MSPYDYIVEDAWNKVVISRMKIAKLKSEISDCENPQEQVSLISESVLLWAAEVENLKYLESTAIEAERLRGQYINYHQ